jgi:hypothetical protein
LIPVWKSKSGQRRTFGRGKSRRNLLLLVFALVAFVASGFAFFAAFHFAGSDGGGFARAARPLMGGAPSKECRGANGESE